MMKMIRTERAGDQQAEGFWLACPAGLNQGGEAGIGRSTETGAVEDTEVNPPMGALEGREKGLIFRAGKVYPQRNKEPLVCCGKKKKDLWKLITRAYRPALAREGWSRLTQMPSPLCHVTCLAGKRIRLFLMITCTSQS
jgi:hypothetical protein